MLHLHVLKSFPKSRSRNQLGLLQDCRAYSSRSSSDNDVADLDAAREWFRNFNKSTIPEKIAKTEFSRSGGAGGQKVNKTSSKATTIWELYALYPHVPKVLYQGLRDSRYYSDNRAENHLKLFDEITRIYKQRVPGITPLEQMKKIEQLHKKLNAGAFKKLRRQTLADAKEKKLKIPSMEKLEAKRARQKLNAASAKDAKCGKSSKARK